MSTTQSRVLTQHTSGTVWNSQTRSAAAEVTNVASRAHMRMEAERGPTSVHATQRTGNSPCPWTYPRTIWWLSVQQMDFKQQVTGRHARGEREMAPGFESWINRWIIRTVVLSFDLNFPTCQAKSMDPGISRQVEGQSNAKELTRWRQIVKERVSRRPNLSTLWLHIEWSVGELWTFPVKILLEHPFFLISWEWLFNTKTSHHWSKDFECTLWMKCEETLEVKRGNNATTLLCHQQCRRTSKPSVWEVFCRSLVDSRQQPVVVCSGHQN